MNASDIAGVLTFLRAAEALKTTHRSGFTSAGEPESVAEHTWRLCLWALALHPAFPEVDFARLAKICIIHDLGEAIGGDVPAPAQVPGGPGKSAAERLDLLQLVEPLAPSLRDEIVELWDEYEAALTPEARLAKALDKLETILQHNQGANPPDFDYLFNLGYARQYTAEPGLIAEIRRVLDDETERRAEGSEATYAIAHDRGPMPEALGGFDPRSTYDEASLDYETACREYWQYMSTRTVERLGLGPGDRVLDVPCGTGAALLSLAERVGPTGRVVGIDYAERMIEIARRKVTAAGLGNVELRVGDMTSMPPEEPYDALQCTLGLFFVDDMAGLVRSLRRHVRSDGGRLAVTVFGEHFYEPMRSAFVSAVAEVVPGFVVIEPWRRTETERVLREIFEAAGLANVSIETEDDELPMRSPQDWWRIVMGSGLRRTITAIGEEAAARVRRRCDAYAEEHGVTTLLNRTRYAVAVS